VIHGSEKNLGDPHPRSHSDPLCISFQIFAHWRPSLIVPRRYPKLASSNITGSKMGSNRLSSALLAHAIVDRGYSKHSILAGFVPSFWMGCCRTG